MRTISRTSRSAPSGARAIIGGLLLGTVLVACGADDQVLQADDDDASVGDGDGDAPGDGDAAGDGDATGDGDASGDGDAAGDGDALGDGDAGSGAVAKDADCDMNGIWAARQVTKSVALGAGQYASNWYYLEFEQNGENVVVKKHFDCGIEVRGTVTVKLTPTTGKALLKHNLQAGRSGTLKKQDGKCVFEMGRFWSIRGADEARFRPTGAAASMDIAEIAATNPIPKSTSPDGAEDWDSDGKLGTAWQVTGIVSGVRNTVQRDWTEWFTDGEYTITPNANWTTDLVTRARFNNQENVFDPASGPITELSTADSTAKHTLTLRFLGRDKSDARAAAILKPADYDTCLAIQAALPAPTSL